MTFDERAHLDDYKAILQLIIFQEDNYKEEPYETTLMQIQYRRKWFENKIKQLEQ